MKKLLFFQGLPGVGKTHFSKALSDQTGFPRVDRDEIKSEIIRRFTSREDQYCRSPKYVTMANEQILKRIEEFFRNNDLVIVDSYIPTEESLKLLYQRFPEDTYQYLVVNLENTNIKLWQERFEKRVALPNQPNSNFQVVMTSLPALLLSSHDTIILDSSKEETLVIEQILRFLS